MDANFWNERWEQGQIAFHEGRPNGFLSRHASRWSGSRRVLVPLCGKTEDLAHLASLGHDVVGVELSEIAGRAFFSEHALEPTETRTGPFLDLRANGVRILVGDFFRATAEILNAPNALYDRAAVIALPEELRIRYVAHLKEILPSDFTGLLVTDEYDQSAMSGPPFSVVKTEVERLWSGVAVEEIDHGVADFPKLRAAGISGNERCYWLGR